MLTIHGKRGRSGQRPLLALVLGASVAAAGAPPAYGQAQETPKLASLAEFSECADDTWNGDVCLEALRAYVAAHPAQAFDAGKAVTLKFAHWAAIGFFEEALASQASPARCKDERLALAVASALGQPSSGKSGETVATGAKILSTRCWNELREPIARKLAQDSGANLTRNACPIYAEKKAAPPACRRQAKAPPKPEPVWEAVDAKQLGLEGSVTVYSGQEGRRVSLAKVKGKPYYLIKFEGFGGPWNGKVILHRQDPAASGHDYVTQLGPKRRYASVVARRPWGESYTWEVYPLGGGGPHHVMLDAKATKEARAEALLAQLGK